MKCYVREYFKVRRCFNCQGYNHKASDCKNKLACIKCGGEHDVMNCNSSEKKCTNCTKLNASLGMDNDCSHSANDKECSVFNRQIKVRKEKTEY